MINVVLNVAVLAPIHTKFGITWHNKMSLLSQCQTGLILALINLDLVGSCTLTSWCKSVAVIGLVYFPISLLTFTLGTNQCCLQDF